MYTKSGGIPKAQSSGQLPRDKQAYNIKKRLSTSGYLSAPVFATNATRDVLFSVMLQCKNAEKTDQFVQEVTCVPEPMAVLCLEQQLTDLNRFCCDPHNFSVLGIDPTYCLGEFSVTPTLLLEHHKTRSLPFFLVQCSFTTGRNSKTTTSFCHLLLVYVVALTIFLLLVLMVSRH